MHYYFEHWHVFLQPCLVFKWAWSCFKAPWGQGTVPWTSLSSPQSPTGYIQERCSVIGISPSPCYYVYIPREGRNSSSRHSFPDPSLPSGFPFYRENAGMCRGNSIDSRRWTLKKSYLEKGLDWASPTVFSYPGLWAHCLVCLGLCFSLPPFLRLPQPTENKQDSCWGL